MKITNVLLVDDDPNIRKLAAMSLERVGKWQVRTACSGPEALAMLAGSELPDLVILDVMMPQMDGITAFKKLREMENCRDVPVVLMTAKSQPEELKEYSSLDVAGIIVKPFDAMTLPFEISAMFKKNSGDDADRDKG